MEAKSDHSTETRKNERSCERKFRIRSGAQLAGVSVRDARFLRIQSSLVPNTIKTRRRSQDKVDVKKNIDNESPEGLEEAPD